MQIHEKLISDSPMLPTQSIDVTLDQNPIIIYATPAITFKLGERLPHIQYISSQNS